MKISIQINDLDVVADKQMLVQLLALLSGNSSSTPEVLVAPEAQATENVPEELPPEKEVDASRPTKKRKSDLTNPFASSDVLIANAYTKPIKDGQPVQVLLVPYGRFAVKSWKDVLVETAEMLITAGLLTYRTIPFAHSQIPLVTTSKRSTRSSVVQLTNGLYMDVGHSAKDIVRRAVALVEACGLSDKAFAVYYKKWSRHE
jgi:hypothetical protein